MLRFMCKGKVHRAKVTQAELYYEGSLTLDKNLMDAAGMIPYEKVQIVNVNNAQRFETYLIEGERHSGIVSQGLSRYVPIRQTANSKGMPQSLRPAGPSTRKDTPTSGKSGRWQRRHIRPDRWENE